jgi:TPR repeat protein
VEKDAARAAELNGRACEGHHVEACFHLAGQYARGDGVARDPSRADELYATVSNGRWMRCRDPLTGTHCVPLARQYAEGLGVPKDLALAAEHYERGCDGVEPEGCHELALLYARGEGVPKDPARARALAAEACERGVARACR